MTQLKAKGGGFPPPLVLRWAGLLGGLGFEGKGGRRRGEKGRKKEGRSRLCRPWRREEVARIITLGTDAEFEVIVDGDVVPVEKLMSVSDVALPWGRIGQDSSGDPIELRPEPSSDPEALVGNLGRTACEVFPIGGHVHIGGVPSEVQEDLVSLIDGLLGDFFYSLSGETRLRAGYGKRGD